MSPRQARRLAPFLVDRAFGEPAAAPVAVPIPAGAPHAEAVATESVEKGDVRLVFRGVALKPTWVAGIAAVSAMGGIGLFLGLMLGDTF